MDAKKEFSKKALLLFVVSLVFILLAVVFRKHIAEFQSFGLAGILLINFFGSATIFLPAPAVLSVFAGGAIYNPFFVATASSLGSAAGEMVGYVLGHSSKHVFLRNHKKSIWHTVLQREFKRYGLIVVFVCAIIPNPLFDVVGIIAGISSYHPFRFFLTVFIARLLRDFVLASVGASFQ